MKHTLSYIPDYPRPQLVRDGWTNLNGEWDFAFDRDGAGERRGYCRGFAPQCKITVPFAYETPASGIGDPALCENVWYMKKLALSPERGKRLLLHIEGCDYATRVWLNGKDCGAAEGCCHRLTFELTAAATAGDNVLVIGVKDSYSKAQPRGKQRWQSDDHGCWYLDATGIYKTVWLETVNAAYIDGVRITPSVTSRSVAFEATAVGARDGAVLFVAVGYGGKRVAAAEGVIADGACRLTLEIPERDLRLWNVGAAELYDAELALTDGNATDAVKSYFGMREIKIDGGRVLLNGKPLYQKLVLDQGYWRNSGLTAESGDALDADIALMTEMGFNGCRKHEKVEDERFMYYADARGYLVWCEMPSLFELTDKSKAAFRAEWAAVVRQMYNHPCIVCWVCFNESWGIEAVKTDKSVQDFVNAVYRDVKSYDGTRPVITNDGWEHTLSDILTIHHYTQDGGVLHDAFDSVEKCVAEQYAAHDRGAYADGYGYHGQPIIISEFGGTAFVRDAVGASWGYGDGVKDDDEYAARLAALVRAIDSVPFISGYCYTQLSDVYHEVNGLTDFDRTPKLAPSRIRAIIDGKE